MNYRFHPEAEAEFREAIQYYEENKQGLGFDFALEVHSAIEQTLGFPNVWPVFDPKVPVWNSLFGGRGWNLHFGCYASAQKSGILETSNLKVPRAATGDEQ